MIANRRTRRTGGLLLLAAVLFGAGATGCGEPPVESSHAGIDESMACPEGWVGWTFGAKPFGGTSTLEQSLRPDAGTPLQIRRAIDVQSVTCNSLPTSNGAQRVRQDCAGKQGCSSFFPCLGTAEISYGCGPGDVDPATGAARVRTVTGTNAPTLYSPLRKRFDLSCPAPAGAGPVAARRTCVPRTCTGQSRRDENLLCVPDTAKPVLYGFGMSVSQPTLTPTDRTVVAGKLDERRPGLLNAQHLYRNGLYDVELKLYYGIDPTTSRAQYPPEEARATLYLVDKFAPKAQRASFASLEDDEGVDAFRCTVTNFDVGRRSTDRSDARRVIAKARLVLSPECFDPQRQTVMKQEAARRARLSVAEFERQYEHVTTHLRVAYDIDGLTHFVPQGKDLQSACAVNPPDFFYSASAKQYDLAAYYAQRELRPSQETLQPYELMEPLVAEFGPVALSLRKPSITISKFSPTTPTIPVDLSWYVANDSPENQFSLTYNPRGAESGWEGKSATNWRPPGLRATIYLYPTKGLPKDYVFKGDFPIVAEIPLETSTPEGTTVSFDARVKSILRNEFFDPKSPLYISPTEPIRQFEVLACLRTDYPEKTFEPRFYMTNRTTSYTLANLGPGGPGPLVLGNDREAAQAFSPFSNGKPGRGCRWSRMPLLITADRVQRALEPTAHEAWPGVQSTSTSGDDKMSGESDNDREERCTTTGGSRDCSSLSRGGMQGMGNLGKSFFDLSTTTRRNQSTRNASVDAEMEVLGFNVLDAADPETMKMYPEVSPFPSGPSQKLKITLEPPWDRIVGALRKAAGRTPVEWSTGRFSGVMGLGVGWGFRTRFGPPIPGDFQVTFSVGFGLSLNLELGFQPEQPYPCKGKSAACYQVQNALTSQGDANEACFEQGGRLAELKSPTEAAAVATAIKGSSAAALWIGGQQGFETPNPTCDEPGKFEATCYSGLRTTFRWLSNDQVFASATDRNAATVDATKLYGGNGASFATRAPTEAGVALNPQGDLKVYAANEQLPSVCVFDPVDDTRFISTKTSLALSAGAGLGVSYCSPSDEVGICLEGSVNAVSVKLEPTHAYAETTLVRGGKPVGHRSVHALSVPWSLTLFEAEIVAKAKLYFTSLSYTLASYDGITIAAGSLFDLKQSEAVDYP